MERQMELFARGGLKDEGGMIDEESGNRVPIGGTREGVRDDIEANVSQGEFILSEDVTRYHGLEKLMNLRQEAKMGLKRMEAMGQMGNSDEATMPDDLPFGMDDLIIVAGSPNDDNGELNMAEGGLTTGTTNVVRTPDSVAPAINQPVVPTTTTTRRLTPVISQPVRTTIDFKKLMGEASIEYKEYRNSAGNNIMIPFIGGVATFPIPDGYFLYTGEGSVGTGHTPVDDIVADTNAATQEVRSRGSDDRTEVDVRPTPVDYDNISNEELLKLAQDQTGTKGTLVKVAMGFMGPLGIFGMLAMSHQSKKIMSTINERIASGIIGNDLKGEFTEVLGLLKKGSGGLVGGVVDFIGGLLGKTPEEIEAAKKTTAEVDKKANPDLPIFRVNPRSGATELTISVQDAVASVLKDAPATATEQQMEEMLTNKIRNNVTEGQRQVLSDAAFATTGGVLPDDYDLAREAMAEVAPVGAVDALAGTPLTTYRDMSPQEQAKRASMVSVAGVDAKLPTGTTAPVVTPELTGLEQLEVGADAFGDPSATSTVPFPNAGASGVPIQTADDGYSLTPPIRTDAFGDPSATSTLTFRNASGDPSETSTFPVTQLPTNSVNEALKNQLAGNKPTADNIMDTDVFNLTRGVTRKDNYIDNLLPPKQDLEATNKFFNNDMLPPRADQQPDVFPDQVYNFPTDATNPAFATSDPRAGTYTPTDLQRNSQVFPTTATVGGGSASNYGEGYTAPIPPRGADPTKVTADDGYSPVPQINTEDERAARTNLSLAKPVVDTTDDARAARTNASEIPLSITTTTPKMRPSGLGAKPVETTTPAQTYKAGDSNQATAWMNLPDANIAQAADLNKRYATTGGTAVDGYAVGAITDGKSQGVYADKEGFALRDAEERVVYRNDDYDVPVVKSTVYERVFEGADKYKPATKFDDSKTSTASTNKKTAVTPAKKNQLSKTAKAKIGTDASGGDPNMAGAVWTSQPGTNVLTRTFPKKSDPKPAPVKPSKKSSGGGSSGGGGGGSSKIVCTAMNESYGFGSYRQAVWLKYSNNNLTKEHEVGYHTLFLPLVELAYQKDYKYVRKTLENIARHRTADLRAEMQNKKRDKLGRFYRAILEPICYLVGKYKMFRNK